MLARIQIVSQAHRSSELTIAVAVFLACQRAWCGEVRGGGWVEIGGEKKVSSSGEGLVNGYNR